MIDNNCVIHGNEEQNGENYFICTCRRFWPTTAQEFAIGHKIATNTIGSGMAQWYAEYFGHNTENQPSQKPTEKRSIYWQC